MIFFNLNIKNKIDSEPYHIFITLDFIKTIKCPNVKSA